MEDKMENFFTADHKKLNTILEKFYQNLKNTLYNYFQAQFNLSFPMHSKQHPNALNNLGLKFIHVEQVNTSNETLNLADDQIEIVTQLCKCSAEKFGFEFFDVENDDAGIPLFVVKYADASIS